MRTSLAVACLALAVLLAASPAETAESTVSTRLDAAAVEEAVTRFVLDPNPALLIGFDAETVPLPALPEAGAVAAPTARAAPGFSREPCIRIAAP